MDRVRRLTWFLVGFFLACSAFSCVASAGQVGNDLWDSQSSAHSACVARLGISGWTKGSCSFSPDLPDGGPNSECGGDPEQHWAGRYVALSDTGGASLSFYYCVPATCDAGTDSPGADQYAQWGSDYSAGDVACNDGCLSRFHFPPSSGVWSISSPDGALNSAWGYWEKSGGGRCQSATDAGLLKKDYGSVACGSASRSCYDPVHGFCYVTEYGEQVCNKKVPGPGSSSGCTAGATGAVCTGDTGNPPPPPSDPPIQKGQPPDTSQTATGKDSGGNTYNYTTNNYSGTSPGGSDPGSSSPPSSGTTDGGGTQSNTSGSGNSPGPNGGKGTDANGKCSDGSVPTASGCSGTFTDVGCDTPPVCYGDAVMCGNAKENWATRCAVQKMAAASGSSSGGLEVGDPSSALAGAGVPSDGGASTDPGTSGLVSSSDLGSDGFDASGLGFSRTCPANPVFNVLGHSYEFDLTPFCNFASLLGWFVLLVAFLVGLRIVATGKA